MFGNYFNSYICELFIGAPKIGPHGRAITLNPHIERKVA